MKLDKIVMLIGGIILICIFVIGIVSNYSSLYEPELTYMTTILLGTLIIGVVFIYNSFEQSNETEEGK